MPMRQIAIRSDQERKEALVIVLRNLGDMKHDLHPLPSFYTFSSMLVGARNQPISSWPGRQRVSLLHHMFVSSK